jgi:hypothetical protein
MWQGVREMFERKQLRSDLIVSALQFPSVYQFVAQLANILVHAILKGELGNGRGVGVGKAFEKGHSVPFIEIV